MRKLKTMLSRSIANRLGLLQAYLSPERDFPLPFMELVARGCLRPTAPQVAKRYIKSIERVPGYWLVHLHTASIPFYWPHELPLSEVHRIVAEIFHPSDWHFYEVAETSVVPGDTVLDCGAAEGCFGVSVCGRAGRVVAFEPQPSFVAALTRTFAGTNNVTIAPYALGEAMGQAYVTGSSLSGKIVDVLEGAATPVPIEIVTVDDYVREQKLSADFIKVDVEGFEIKLLHGAAETVQRDKPKIAITVYHPHNNWEEMMTFLRSLVPEYKYRLKGILLSEGVPRPVMMHVYTDPI